MPSSAPSTPGAAAAVGPGYRDQRHWRHYQDFFPGALRTTDGNAPVEQWWSWRGMSVHLDRLPRPDAPATLIALHGVGTYGRMLAPFGRLPGTSDLEFVAPDLPGFGLTDTGRRGVTYRTWVDCVVDLVAAERARGRPVVLLGLSAGGRLAYDVAARAGDDVAAVIVTCLADPRLAAVRRRLATRPELAHWAGVLSVLPPPLRAPRLPVHLLANIAAVANHAQFANLVWNDPLGGGNWISLGFLRSCLAAPPTVAPEDFGGPPLLLAHPDDDRWTPLRPSREFFDRIAAPTRFATLSGTGHFPVEESGLADLDRAVRDFLDEFAIQ
ncbi:alpha/beta hydrolase [Saccharopolyspora cebuensis]|uniref:Alpha/beta hydrolase n=1 Tax=Saccharopolyspora cebuensis TaxID=418759 RepID=A0ABV4CMY4_9PSEU